VPFHHRCSSRQIFGVRRILPEFPQTCPKSFLCNFCLQIFSHKNHEDLFLVWPPKNCLHVFLCKPWASYFEIKQRWAPFLPGFSERHFYPDFLFVKLLPRFSANQNFWGCACNPCIPISSTTAFHDSIIGNFMVYQDRLETNLLRLFRQPENSEWFSIISVIIFEVTIVDEQKQTYNW